MADFYKKFFIILLVVTLALPSFCFAQLPQEKSGKIFINEKIFYMSRKREQEGILSLQKNADKIDIIAPQFYDVSEELKLVGDLSPQLKEIIKQKELKVMPLVVNQGFRQSIINNLLISDKAQEDIIESLVSVAKKEKYIGWQFDFENISYLDRDLYSAFIEKTAKVLHNNGLIFSVAAVARSVDYEDTDFYKNWSGVFDYGRIAKAVDFISLMTYDDPNSTGPIASLSFINKVLNYVENKIPPEKLSLGIPLYNWGWRVNPLKKISYDGTYAGLLYIKSNFNHKINFDESIGESCLTYYYRNKKYEVWFQDKKSFEKRLEIISKNGFRGFSAWVLGIEDPAIWTTLQ